MVWVYDRTESLLVAVLMYASLIVSSISGSPSQVVRTTVVALLTAGVVLGRLYLLGHGETKLALSSSR